MKMAFSLLAAGGVLLYSAFGQAPAPAQPVPAPPPAPAPPPPAPLIEPPAVTSPAPVAPAPAPETKAPSADPPKAAKKKTTPKKTTPAPKAASPAPEPPDNPTPATVTGDRVNVRGRASLVGEVITQLRKGEAITVLSETAVKTPKPGEPPAWAKIVMPANVPVWIHASFVDPATQTVKAARLNVRAGPGENFSVIGRLNRGEAYKPLRQVDDWIEIETPPGTYGYVAANLIQKTAALTRTPEPAPAAVPAPAPVETVKAETPPAPPPSPAPAPAEAPAPPAVGDPPPPEPFVAPAPQPPPPRRVVTREGVVRYTVSPRAPSDYCLVEPDTDRVIAYLISAHSDLNFRHLANQRMIFTGEEYLDARWRNRTVLKVETVEAAP